MDNLTERFEEGFNGSTKLILGLARPAKCELRFYGVGKILKRGMKQLGGSLMGVIIWVFGHAGKPPSF